MADENTKSNEEIAKEKVIETAAELLNGEDVHIVWESKKSPAPLPLHEQEKVGLSGTIEAPYEFISKRKADHPSNGVTVVYNLELGKIILVADERNHFKTTIGGSLKLNPKIEALGINTDKKYNLTDFKKMVRFNKNIFKNESEHAEMIKALNEFTSKVSQELKKQDDGQGNIDERFLQTVSSNLKPSFIAKLQIFKGHQEREFPVDIILVSVNRNVEFWLESPVAVNIIDDEREGLVMAQIDKLKQDYVCIQE